MTLADTHTSRELVCELAKLLRGERRAADPEGDTTADLLSVRR